MAANQHFPFVDVTAASPMLMNHTRMPPAAHVGPPVFPQMQQVQQPRPSVTISPAALKKEPSAPLTLTVTSGDGSASTQGEELDGMDEHFTKQTASFMTCKYCDYISKQRDRMVRHVRNVHLKERPFSCEVCSHNFGRKDKLKRHIQTVHSTEKPFKCDYCSHSSNRKDKLKAHVMGVHFKTNASQQAKRPKKESAPVNITI